MSYEAVRKAWLVAASIGAVEASKDQGVARWNGPLRELHRHAETKLTSSYLKTTLCSMTGGEYRMKRTKDGSMNKVMEMNYFGPNSVRF
ncbi:hypothetical protein CTI12_AA034760 [Artemisia annua]|uniref:Wound-responsive family protein n=1 Tax=Artemisia annua TaxID=35608 RepID=A0A2U1PU57_ARTAN|nr:hypothetical protein CTI12_AA034760 [Artemisia annua]